MLKGFLVYHGQTPLSIHDLVALLALCARLDTSLSASKADCGKLTDFAIIARYPSGLAEPGPEKVARWSQ